MSYPAGTARSTADVSPLEFVLRAIVFGLLVLGAVAAVVTAGTWWAAGIAVVGKLAAIAGLVVSVLALLREDQARSWRASRIVAAGLAATSIVAIVLAVTLP
jgi:hypothetical protein